MTRRHEADGVSLALPDGWPVVGEELGAVVAVAEPYRDGRFTANIVVSRHETAEGESEVDWVGRVVAETAAEVPRMRLIDAEDLEIDGRPCARVLAHYPLPEFGGVVVEQWMVLEPGAPLLVSCTVAATEYDERADLFAEVAHGVRLIPGPTSEDGDA
jgi:hypothetical protein